MDLEKIVKTAFSEKRDQEIMFQWLQKKSENDKQDGLSALAKYCKYADKTPSQLIEDRIKEYKRKNGESIKDFVERKKGSERLFQETFNQIKKEEKLTTKQSSFYMMWAKMFYSYWGHPLWIFKIF